MEEKAGGGGESVKRWGNITKNVQPVLPSSSQRHSVTYQPEKLGISHKMLVFYKDASLEALKETVHAHTLRKG